MPIDLNKIPEGTWVKRKNDTVIIKALLKDKLIENLLIGLIVFCMTIPTLILMIYQMIQGETSVYFGLLVISLCLLFLSYFIPRTLMSLFGRVEIQLDETQGTIFHGIRNWGRTQIFVYKKTTAIDIYTAVYSHNVPVQFGIKIEEEKTIIFGGYLKEKKVHFIVKILHTFLKDGEKIRDLLPPDLMHNLID